MLNKARVGLLLLALVTVGAGCQQAAAPPAMPATPLVVAGRTHYMGTPLSGPMAEAAPAGMTAGNAWAVEVTMVSLDRMPVSGDSLAQDAAFLIATRGTSVVLPSSRLTRGARYAPPDQPAALAEFRGAGQELLPKTAGAVPVGATASFKVAEAVPQEDRATNRPWRRGVEVDVFRPALSLAKGPATAPALSAPVTLEVALVVDDFAQPDRVDRSAETPAAVAAPSPQRELAIVDIKPHASTGSTGSPQAGSGQWPIPQTFAFAVPFRFTGSSGQAVAAIITVGPPSSDKSHVDAFNDCENDLALSFARAASGPAGATAAGEEGAALQVALDALKQPWRRRSAFIYLAGLTGADLCGDASLVADDVTIDRVAGKVLKGTPGDHPDPAAIGWLLDQTWFLDMGELLGNARLSPELSAVLATHAGEAGRHQSSIEEVGKAAHIHADYESLLQQENMIFLEDSSPSARARAFDWLQARGKAPAGYDPLGGDKDRRTALERFVLGLPPPATQPATAPATEPTTEPTTSPSAEPATVPLATTAPATGPSTEPVTITSSAEPVATTSPTTRADAAPSSTAPVTQPVDSDSQTVPAASPRRHTEPPTTAPIAPSTQPTPSQEAPHE